MLYVDSFISVLYIIAVLSLPITIPLLVIYDKNRTRKKNAMLLAAQNGTVEEQSCNETPKPKKHIQFSSSSFMLMIGTALVILSGIAFGVANWVKTTPTGRVSIIMIAAAASFAVSTLFRKVLKLERTSAAFYCVGTVFSATALITAGFYKLMGDWLAVNGEGFGMLLALSSFTVSVLSLIGAKMYTHKALSYTGLLAISAGMLFMTVQAADDSCHAVGALIIMQAAITAVFHLFGMNKHFPDYIPVKNAADITSALYGGLSLAYALATVLSPDVGTFLVLITLLVQTIVYGVKMHSPVLHGFRSVIAEITAFAAAFAVSNGNPDTAAIFTFGLLAVIIFAADTLIPVIRTRFSIILSLSVVFIGGIINSSEHDAMCCTIGIISALALYAYSVYSKERVSAGFFGILSPVIPISLCFSIDYIIFHNANSSHLTVSIIITAAFFIAAALIISSVMKKKSLAVYSGMVTSAVMLFLLPNEEEHLVLIILAAIAHLFVSERFRVNWTAFGSSAVIIAAVSKLIDDISFSSDRTYALFFFAVFIAFMAVSRIFHHSGLFIRSNDRLSIDTIQLMSWMFILFSCTDCDYAGFVKTLALTAYLANFVRKNTDKNTASVIYTISVITAAFAVITRPFSFFANDMIEYKTNLAVIALAGAAFSLIWKSMNKAVHVISSVTYLIAYAGLIADAIHFHSAGNTIFVLSVTVGILLLSFFCRNKTWFTASSVSLIIITLWSSREYLKSLNWWAYLFIAGMLLIGAAAVNEYLKKKGKTIRSAVNDKFNDWAW